LGSTPSLFTAQQPGEPTAICPTSPIRSSPRRTGVAHLNWWISIVGAQGLRPV